MGSPMSHIYDSNPHSVNVNACFVLHLWGVNDMHTAHMVARIMDVYIYSSNFCCELVLVLSEVPLKR